jgi:Flp pilus assembly protein TadD
MAADAIAVAPSSPWAHCALADLLLERGSAEAADAAYHAALQCPGSTPDIAAMLSVARSRKGDLAGAVSAARDARNGAPENVQFVMRHAALLDAAKEFAAAEAAWREASARMPSDPVPLRQLAISLHNAGRVPEATVAAQAAIALAPDDPDLASFLGAQPGTQPAGAELRAHSPVADAPKPPPLPAPTLQLVSAPSSEPEPPKPAGDPTPPTTRAWQVLTSQAPEDAGPAAPPAPKPGLLRRLFGAKR